MVLMRPPPIADTALATRVAVQSTDPARSATLAARVAAAGYEVADARDADVMLSDRVVLGPRPLLVLTDSAVPPGCSAIPADAPTVQLRAAITAAAAGLVVTVAAAGRLDVPLLTPREVDILACVSKGMSNKSVARRLGISQHTVKFHLEAVFAKLESTSRAEAVVKALRFGLIDL